MKAVIVVLCWVAMKATWSIDPSKPHRLSGLLCSYIPVQCDCQRLTYGYDMVCTDGPDWHSLLQILKDKFRGQIVNRLRLVNFNLSRIGENDLKGIKISQFGLIDCIIGEIDEGAFSGNASINDLYWMGLTEMKEIPRAVANANLMVYRHENGVLTSVQKQFQNMTLLEVIDLSHNKISHIDPEAFENCHQLQIVDISYNRIQQLDNKLFINSHNLTFVYMTDNQLNSTVGALIPFATSLQIVWLNANIFTNFSEAVNFVSFAKMVELSVTDNPLKVLNRSQFDGKFKELTKFILRNTSLQEIEKNTFDTLNNLEFINLSHNNLSKLPEDLFARNLKLKEVRLDNNNIRTISRLFLNNTSLDRIYLSFNKIKDINGAFTTLSRLRWISIDNNLIETIPGGTFKYTSRLTGLHLFNNSVRTITNGSFLGLGEKLQVLDLTNNSLEHLGGTFSSEENLPNLMYLHLGQNILRSLSHLDLNFKNLVRLDVPSNYLFKLDRAFVNMKKLQVLNLARNELSTIQEDNFYVDGLKTKPRLHVQELDISSNKLTRFPDHLWNYMNLTKGRFSGNPWICDCDAEPFRTFLLKNYRVVPDVNQTKCYDGIGNVEIGGRVIITLLGQDLCPLHISVYIPGAATGRSYYL